jgi:predicted nucleic acid-binding protein
MKKFDLFYTIPCIILFVIISVYTFQKPQNKKRENKREFIDRLFEEQCDVVSRCYNKAVEAQKQHNDSLFSAYKDSIIGASYSASLLYQESLKLNK